MLENTRPWIEAGRVAGQPDDVNGHFQVMSPTGSWLTIIASDGYGADEGEGASWEHVSVSTPTRVPTWGEMEFVKRSFFRDDEWAMQLHAPPVEHINIHDHVLHIWRPKVDLIPLPPKVCV